MLLHPDGTEEVLVAAGEDAIADPFVSFDGAVGLLRAAIATSRSPRRQAGVGADIYKIHVKTRTIMQLTQQEFTPNTGVAGSKGTPARRASTTSAPVRCPAARSPSPATATASMPTKGYTPTVALQLFVMDDDGSNVERSATSTSACALHPVILKDGRIMFSSL